MINPGIFEYGNTVADVDSSIPHVAGTGNTREMAPLEMQGLMIRGGLVYQSKF